MQVNSDPAPPKLSFSTDEAADGGTVSAPGNTYLAVHDKGIAIRDEIYNGSRKFQDKILTVADRVTDIAKERPYLAGSIIAALLPVVIAFAIIVGFWLLILSPILVPVGLIAGFWICLLGTPVLLAVLAGAALVYRRAIYSFCRRSILGDGSTSIEANDQNSDSPDSPPGTVLKDYNNRPGLSSSEEDDISAVAVGSPSPLKIE